MKVWLLGMGCGVDTWTEGAESAISRSELIFGATRLLEELPEHHATLIAAYRPGEIFDHLQASNACECCVLYSGESGFYSGAAGLLPLLREAGIPYEVLPGISSLQCFAARLGQSWQDWRLCSAHGVEPDPVWEVMQGRSVFFLTSGAEGAAAICQTLVEAGLGALRVSVGENLGRCDERVTAGTAAELAAYPFAPLNVLLIEPAPLYPPRAPGIPDDAFLRGKAPMTKQEVRAAILARLGVKRTDLCWDVGAGTGSVSIELALHARAVYAVERKPEAMELARKNRERFRAWNLRLLEGCAPQALGALPRPDAVFVGGSGGKMNEILNAVYQANPEARICVSAIALETLHTATEALARLGYDVQVTQISVSRTRSVGGLHLLSAQNPVFLITGVQP